MGQLVAAVSGRIQAKGFTRFRSSVNAAIAPHEVNHIDFVTKPGIRREGLQASNPVFFAGDRVQLTSKAREVLLEDPRPMFWVGTVERTYHDTRVLVRWDTGGVQELPVADIELL